MALPCAGANGDTKAQCTSTLSWRPGNTNLGAVPNWAGTLGQG